MRMGLTVGSVLKKHPTERGSARLSFYLEKIPGIEARGHSA